MTAELRANDPEMDLVDDEWMNVVNPRTIYNMNLTLNTGKRGNTRKGVLCTIQSVSKHCPLMKGKNKIHTQHYVFCCKYPIRKSIKAIGLNCYCNGIIKIT